MKTCTLNYFLTSVGIKIISALILVCLSDSSLAQQLIRTHISGSDTTIALNVVGTLDAVNTRKYQHESIIRYNQSGVENNISFSLENRGTKDIINPQIAINGRRMIYSMQDLLSQIPLDGLSTIDDTVKTIWNFLWGNYYHSLVSTEAESNRIKPIKTFNVFGSGQCENAAQVMCSMLKYLGYKEVYPIGLNYYHTVGLLKVNGRSIILDPDLKTFYTKRDNKTLADLESIIWDRDLASRQHHGGFETSEIVLDDDIALGYTDLKRTGYLSYYDWTATDTMFLRIRPNEQIIFNYDSSVGNRFSYYNSANDYNERPVPANSSLGIVKYNPRFCYDWLNSIYKSENAETDGKVIYSADPSKPASITIDFTTPYVWTNGEIVFSYSKFSQGFLRISVKKGYHNDYTILSETNSSFNGDKTDTINLFEFIKPNKYPYNGDAMTNLYYVKIEWLSDSLKGITVDSLKFENTFQLNPNALPRLNVGRNTIKIVSKNGEPFDNLLYSHTYKEVNDYSVPSPPDNPVHPQNGGIVKSSQFEFVWSLPNGMSSSEITDFNIEVSEYPDFRFPVSSTFNKLTSQQHDGHLPFWKIPHMGLLSLGTTYYWHVAVRNDHGVWSNWSKPWSFTIDAVGVPLNPTYTNEGDSIIIKWQTNHAGKKPVQFYVLASNERGFSYHEPLIIDSTENNFYTIKNASKILGYAFYRIVAADENNLRSGISDLIAIEERLLYNCIPSIVHDSINLELVKIEPIDFYGRSGPPGYTPYLVFDSLIVTSVILPGGLKLENNTIKGKFTSSGDTLIEIAGRTYRSNKTISKRINFKVNFSPRIVGLTKMIAKSDTNFQSQVIAEDPDGDSVIYSSNNLPHWLTLDSLSGVLSGTPSVEDAGDQLITIKVIDDKGGVAQSNFKIRVWAESPYFAIESVSDSVFLVEQMSSIETNVNVAPGYNHQIRYQLLRGPRWLRVNSKTGKISGRPSVAEYGKDYPVFIRATDSNRLFSNYTFSVHITRANTAPRFVTQPNIVYFYDSLYQSQVKAVDDDILFGDSVVKYVLLQGPQWLSLDSSGLLSGLFEDTLGKKYEVIIGAIDSFGDTSLQAFTLRVFYQQSNPGEFILHQNYPNPFGQSTTIPFDVPGLSRVKIVVVNLMGTNVVTLTDGYYNTGYHRVRWDAANVSSGVYFVIATINSLTGNEKKTFTTKIVLVK